MLCYVSILIYLRWIRSGRKEDVELQHLLPDQKEEDLLVVGFIPSEQFISSDVKIARH